jgi:putative DNA primase/helicase
MNESKITNLLLPASLSLGANKKPYATIENLEKILRVHNIIVKYNPIAKDVEITIPNQELPIESKMEVASSYITSLVHEYNMNSGWVFKYLVAIAHKNRFNPVQEWIESRPWDGISRLDDFFNTVTPEDKSTIPLRNRLMQRWLISAVAAAYEPEGISAGGLLVFQGKQYIGKTKWFKSLVPQTHSHLIKDGMALDTKNKDSLIYVLSRWIVELGEIEGTFNKSDLAALKAFITADKDTIRCPYDRVPSNFPRSTVFFGSVNDKKFLSDTTGNRRFWTIACDSINYNHEIDMQQLWAEVKVLYDNGEKWHLDIDEYQSLSTANEEFEMIDPMAEKIKSYFKWDTHEEFWGDNWKTATAILEQIGYKTISRAEATKCGAIVHTLNNNQWKRTGKGKLLRIPPVE